MKAVTMLKLLGAGLLVLGDLGTAIAQQGTGMREMPKAQPAGVVAPEQLPSPRAMVGIGNSFLAITTANPQAQVWFTQGLNLLHDFWDYEASRAFEQSVRSDPNCAMCWWGLYQSESFRGEPENEVYAASALEHAMQLSKSASPAERLYIKSAEQEQKQKADKKKKDAALAKKKRAEKHTGELEAAGYIDISHVDSKATKTLRKLVEQQPEDVQAKIFLAESLMDGFDQQGLANPGTVQGQALLHWLLQQHPDDSAANHYWIHAVEPGQHPELALESARKLGGLAPASGHMVHMPGHIFYRTGDYESARVSFETSMHVDEAYMQAQQVSVNDDWNYVHNLMYLIADLLEAGRIAEATAVSAKLNAARGDSSVTLYRYSTRDGLTRLNVELPVALRAGDWKLASSMLEASHPAEDLKNLAALRASLLDYTQGMAALDAGDKTAAAKLSAALDASLQATPPEDAMAAMPGMSPSKDAMGAPLHSYLDVAAAELRACVLQADGRNAEADAEFAKAARAESLLGYREPPYYIRPVGETRGDALMRAARYADARKAYEAALLERPDSGYPLYGIAQADVAAKNTTAATADFLALEKAWSRADAGLPQLNAAQTWLTTHGSSATTALRP